MKKIFKGIFEVLLKKIIHEIQRVFIIISNVYVYVEMSFSNDLNLKR